MIAGEQQVRSRFRVWALIPIIFLLPSVTIFLVGLAIFFEGDIVAATGFLFLFLLLMFTWCWLMFGELRRKLIKVIIERNMITIRNFLGWGGEQTYMINEFDGFVTCMVPSRYDTYEYLYLMQGKKKVVQLSAYYHRNYNELKQAIALHSKDLGSIPYSLRQDVREIFTRL